MHSRKVLDQLQAYLRAIPSNSAKKLKDGGSTGTRATTTSKTPAKTTTVSTPSGIKTVTPKVTGTAKTTSTSKTVQTPSGPKVVAVPSGIKTITPVKTAVVQTPSGPKVVTPGVTGTAKTISTSAVVQTPSGPKVVMVPTETRETQQNNAADAGIMALAKKQEVVNQNNAADAKLIGLADAQEVVNQNNAADARLIALANNQAEVNQNNAADARLIALANNQTAVNQNNAADAGIMALANKQAEVNQNNATDAQLVALANNTGTSGSGTSGSGTSGSGTSGSGTSGTSGSGTSGSGTSGSGTTVDLTKLVDIGSGGGSGGSSSGGGGSSSGGGGSSSGGGGSSSGGGGAVTPPVVTPPVVTPPPPAPWSVSRPPPGYRYGFDPEWDYQFKAPVVAPLAPAVPKAAAGGRVSTGNAVADRRIAAGDQRVTNNQKAAAMYAAQDNARTGADIPEHLKQWLPTENPRGPSGRAMEDGMGAAKSYRNFWDRINGAGPGAGYTNPLDWINGGGMGGSYANPGTNIHGLGAAVYDLQQGGIGALARDLVNGAGLGASGDKFRGGQYALLANTIGIRPAGDKKSIFNRIPEASPELEKRWAESRKGAWRDDLPEDQRESKWNLNNLLGTEGTGGTGGTEGTVARYAEGGITDLAAERAPAQPPMGNEKELISSAIAAIKGQVEDPRPVLGAFLAKYGEEALRNLVDKVESGEVDGTAARSEGMLRGPGDGMDDRIPATVGGEQDVLLANNEYIVPADVISALGNGSSDAGAEHMDKMLERVRTAAHGKATQQKKVSADKVLPA